MPWKYAKQIKHYKYHITGCSHTITINWNLNQINFLGFWKLVIPPSEIRPVIHTALSTKLFQNTVHWNMINMYYHKPLNTFTFCSI